MSMTLADLTRSQLTTAFGVLTGTPVTAKTFNSRATATSRIEALMAERGLALEDVLAAAGIDGGQPLEGDEEEAEETLPEEFAEDEPEAEADPEIMQEQSEAEDPMPAILRQPEIAQALADALNQTLLDHGAEEVSAREAVTWISDAMDQAARRRKPRSNRGPSKQDQVIALLRRPEGATIAEIMEATNWQRHTVHGAFAGAFRKRLGLNVVSEKPEGQDRIYRIAD